MSKLRPDLFTDNFVQQLMNASNADSLEDDSDDELVPETEDFLTSIKKLLKQFVAYHLVTEINEKKFKIEKMHRNCLTFLHTHAAKDQKSSEKYGGSFEDYESLSIEFFSRYAKKLFYKITKNKRHGEVDHNIVSMHLRQGIWSWAEDDEDDEWLLEFN